MPAPSKKPAPAAKPGPKAATDPKPKAPPAAPYDRYGITGSPFRDLSSESVTDVQIFHVHQAEDQTLDSVLEETLAKENKAVVAIVGTQGSGKTERLLLVASEARSRKAFAAYFPRAPDPATLVQGLLKQALAASPLGGFAKVFSPPTWYKELSALTRSPAALNDRLKVAQATVATLNALAPSFLLLNDLDVLASGKEGDFLAAVLQELADRISPGVAILFSCLPANRTKLNTARPALASRINQSVALSPLSPEEGSLLLAKRLLAKRLVEDLDPLYPFDQRATGVLTEQTDGNPRRLLRVAGLALEYGAREHVPRMSEDVVRAVLATRPAAGAPRSPTPPGSDPPSDATEKAGLRAPPLPSGLAASPRPGAPTNRARPDSGESGPR